MQKRRRRDNQRDMIALGGWIFADLLLGLAMLFFTANTVGTPAPTPTPPPTPNLLATSQATVAALSTQQALAAAERVANDATATAAAQTAQALGSAVAESDTALATAAARATQDALLRIQATATAEALATLAAMSADERATAAARATEEALAAEATMAAFATAQAEDAADIDQLTRDQATAAARATLEAISAQATIEALATEAALVAAIATENAQSGANELATARAQAAAAEATIAALTASQSLSESELATAQAAAANVQATIAALEAQQAGAQATATALAAVAAASSLDPNSAQETIQTDLGGMIGGSSAAQEEALEQLRQVLAKYQTGCRAGFVLISGNAPSVEAGVDLARVVEGLLFEEFGEIFGDSATEHFALPNQPPFGQVGLQIFFYQGCQPAG